MEIISLLWQRGPTENNSGLGWWLLVSGAQLLLSCCSTILSTSPHGPLWLPNSRHLVHIQPAERRGQRRQRVYSPPLGKLYMDAIHDISAQTLSVRD